MTEQAIDLRLTFTELQVLKAIPRDEIFMSVTKPGTWRRRDGRKTYTVTSTMRPLLERGLVAPDPGHADGIIGARVTAAGYAAFSRAAHRPPKKNQGRN